MTGKRRESSPSTTDSATTSSSLDTRRTTTSRVSIPRFRTPLRAADWARLPSWATGPGRIGRKSFADTYFKAFGPRLGLAYQLTDKTVLRSGYGIYYAQGNANAGLRDSLSASSGFSANPTFQTTDQGVTPPSIGTPVFRRIMSSPPSLVRRRRTALTCARFCVMTVGPRTSKTGHSPLSGKSCRVPISN